MLLHGNNFRYELNRTMRTIENSRLETIIRIEWQKMYSARKL